MSKVEITQDTDVALAGAGDPVLVTADFEVEIVQELEQGPPGPPGPAGPSGGPGVGGPPGPQGPAGNSVIYGTGAPTGAIGNNGDTYIDTVTHFIYGPKAGGVWPAGVSLVGPAGPRGNAVLYGAGAPASGTGIAGDFYINTSTNFIYGPKTTTWPAGTSLVGPQGIQGPIGPQGNTGATGNTGAVGPQGPQGLPGNTIWYGTGAPTSGIGADGDFYIDTAANFIYGPKASGAWPAGTSLVGPRGNAVLYGTVAPTAGIGVNGDFYINTTTNFIYGPKASGAWPAGTSLIGPQGPVGVTGATGAVGPVPWTSPPAPWVTATNYVVGPPASMVLQGGSSYVCTVSHLSGVFATDLAAGKWALVAQSGGVFFGDTPPPTPADGSLWWNSTNAQLYIRYNDGNSSQWVVVVAAPSPSALQKNYIINGAMMVSQENGATAGSTTLFYPVDQFYYSIGGSTGAASVQQVVSRTPAGSPNRIRVTVTTADAAMTTNKNVGITQIIEGLRIADLAAGLATARAVTLRFGIKAPAGTYCVALRNGGVTRAYIGECVVSPAQANIDSVMALALTMDTTGTWASDTTAGLNISWTLMCGPTYQTPAGVWTAGNFLASANQFNFMGTAGNVFELFDVGLYQGSTGTAPAFQVPDFASDRTLCQRYFWRMGGPAYLAIGSNGLYSDANQILMADYFAAMLLNMRTAPVPATTSLIGTQGTDWAVVSSGGVNQTGFSVAYNTSAAGMASVSKTSHGLVNASLQLLTANGALVRNARM